MAAETTTSSDQAAEHRSWRRWAIGSVVVLLLALTPIVALHLHDASLVAEANHLITELDRTEPGWRTLAAEREPLPADRDSMVAVRHVMALLPKHWGKEIDDNLHSMIIYDSCPAPCILPTRDNEDLTAVLKRSDAALTAALAIEDLPDGRPHAKPGDMLDSTEAQQTRQVAQLLEYAIYDRLQRKDQAGAWKACLAQANLSKPFDRGSIVTSLVRVALDAIANAGVEHILAHGEVPEADLTAMQKRFAEEAEAEFFFPYLPSECAFWLKTCDDVLADPTNSRKTFDNFWIGPGVKKEELGWWGQLNDRFPRFMYLKSKVDSVERMAAMYRLRPLRSFARYDAMEKLDREVGPPAKDGTQRLTWSVSTIVKVAQAERRIRARLCCAQVGLAAERHRLQFGHWPATPGELVDKGLLTRVPEDPFDGNPLRMRRFADGLVVYAVGKKKDYAGTDWDNFDDLESRNREGTEFRLWNPDRRHQPPIPPRKKDDAGGPPLPPE